jgi:hypothetical protein
MADPKDTTPEKMNFPEDTRSKKEAQDPKNTFQHVTRSGHVFELGDNAEGEHITLQHRGGSMIQFQPDGKISISSSDGMYTAVFGENRMYITGAYDIVVDGGASMKVKGDYNVTVDGDYNLTVSGSKVTSVGKNHCTIVKEQINVFSDTEVHRIKTGIEFSSEGFIAILSGTYMRIVSATSWIWVKVKDSLRVDADKRIGLYSQDKQIHDSQKGMDIRSKTGMKLIDPTRIDLNPPDPGRN